MGWFGNRKRENPEPPPEWAPYFKTLDRYDRFESIVRAHFAGRGVKVMISDGVVSHAVPGREPARLGLENLGQLCAQSEESEWPTLIGQHFEGLQRGEEERARFESLGHDFAAISGMLALRLYEPEHLAPVLDQTVCWHDVPGLVTVLCIDTPSAVHTVTRERAGQWGKTDDELKSLALSNTEPLLDAEAQEVDTGGSTKLIVLGGNSYFNASIMLFPERLASFTGRFGGFVSVPTRSLALAIPFDDPAALQDVAALMHFTMQFVRDGPGSLSPRVWWHRGERRIELPYEVSDRGIQVFPDEEFQNLLSEELGGGA